MCGISGFAGYGDRSDIERMRAALAHRGPDGTGYFHDPAAHLYFAHARLSVVDLAGGTQPMKTADGRFTIVFNGEIYNHADLRKELERLGHVFTTDHSDTETILIGYRHYGPDILLKLNGMFAFAIFDAAEKKIFFARDRFGEKPFYYFHHQGCFAFSSELTSLCRHRAAPRRQNETALIKLLGHGYIPAPHTIVDGCYKLPAGHAGFFDTLSGALRTFSYWTFRIEPDDIEFNDATLAQKTDELSHLIEKSVKDRMLCDVPLGTLLSGGIDSSIITAYASRLSPQPVKTYSVGFHEKSFDESIYARMVAQHLKTDHHTNFYALDNLTQDMIGTLGFLDEPLGDASFLPTTFVCEQTRKDVTVALTGDGGDELFFGYDPFDAVGPARFVDRFVPHMARRFMNHAVQWLPRSDQNMSLDFKARRFLQGFDVPEAARLCCWMAPMTPAQISDLFGRRIDAETIYSEAFGIWDETAALGPIDRMGTLFTRLYLADDILMKADRASMRVALELRSPFLDYDIADFARKLPAAFKYQKGRRKLILKEVGKRYLPPEIMGRRKKGFGVPLATWMRRINYTHHNTGLGQINLEKCKKMWHSHRENRADWRYALWCDVVLNSYGQIAHAPDTEINDEQIRTDPLQRKVL